MEFTYKEYSNVTSFTNTSILYTKKYPTYKYNA